MSGRREVAYGLGSYGAYLFVRRLVWNDAGRDRARRNAWRIIAVEQRLGIEIEPSVQRAALRWPRLVTVVNAGYAAGNVMLSIGSLAWLYRRGDASFRTERRAALVAFFASLPVFAALPTAPPRTLAGFVDTLAEHGWSLDHPLIVHWYNPIAAMPSQHVAFAVITGFGWAAWCRRPSLRWAWRAYPAAVALVVVATGNHFVLDVAAGALLGGLARLVVGVVADGVPAADAMMVGP